MALMPIAATLTPHSAIAQMWRTKHPLLRFILYSDMGKQMRREVYI